MPNDKDKTVSRKIHLDMELEFFEVPPCGDVLVLGRHAPVGPKSAQKMMDTICPGLFELIIIDDETIEALIIKRQLLLMADKQTIVDAVLEETGAFMSQQLMIKIKCGIKILVSKSI
ncbi:hypothetical protein [Desulfotignum balticum]|uniref:hypothetical protein n=1 Tax=Desulfotignum balticum TaxID=115781 RepID=UPI00041CEEBD|nr:hypothetical protein [Desulfotignum balticum]